MKYHGINNTELKEIRKYILHDLLALSNGSYLYTQNMTLLKYLKYHKELILAHCDTEGIYSDIFGLNLFKTSRNTTNLFKASSIKVARLFMDGRGMFSPHGCVKNGRLSAKNDQWYHKDRIHDKKWFKTCIHNGIGRCGHPTETISGNFDPREIAPNKWIFYFSTGHRCTPIMLKSYLYMKRKQIPVYIYKAEEFLTKKEKLNLASQNITFH